MTKLFQAFQEFVETFQEGPSKTSKVWVKAGTYDAGRRRKFFYYKRKPVNVKLCVLSNAVLMNKCIIIYITPQFCITLQILAIRRSQVKLTTNCLVS